MVVVIFVYLMEGDAPKESGPIIYMLVGGVSTAWGAAINYFLGSSSGSADKSKTISEMMKK